MSPDGIRAPDPSQAAGSPGNIVSPHASVGPAAPQVFCHQTLIRSCPRCPAGPDWRWAEAALTWSFTAGRNRASMTSVLQKSSSRARPGLRWPQAGRTQDLLVITFLYPPRFYLGERDKDRQRQSGASGTLSTTAVGWGARTGCFGLPEWVAATSKLHPWSPWWIHNGLCAWQFTHFTCSFQQEWLWTFQSYLSCRGEKQRQGHVFFDVFFCQVRAVPPLRLVE